MTADGTWNVTLDSPLGKQDGKLILATDGQELSGVMESEQGSLTISDGQADGNTLTWRVKVAGPLSANVTATVEGDTITGQAKLGRFGNATFSGTRA